MIGFFKLLNAPCRDMTALVSRALDERLTFGQRVAVRSHLLYCRACRRFRKQTQQLHDALRNQPADGTRWRRPVPNSSARKRASASARPWERIDST
jgi:predicted anti-sigma-YlaC factor YlaD